MHTWDWEPQKLMLLWRDGNRGGGHGVFKVLPEVKQSIKTEQRGQAELCPTKPQSEEKQQTNIHHT